jgi:hypothetical protein
VHLRISEKNNQPISLSRPDPIELSTKIQK